MIVGSGIHADPAAGPLLESDRRYFALGAERATIGPGEGSWIPGFGANPAGCTYHVGYPGQRATPADRRAIRLDRIEGWFASLGSPIARIYTPAGAEHAGALCRAGYRHRVEIGYLRRAPAPHDPGPVRLRPVRSARDWADKLRIHAAGETASDGHLHTPRDWVAIERKRSQRGGIAWYLAELGGETFGALGMMRTGHLTRMKNVYVRPDFRRRGLGTRLLDCVFSRELRAAPAAVGVFGVAGTIGERLYRSGEMIPVCAQVEWTRRL